MPATLRFRGDCQPRRQVDHIVPANVGAGDTFTLTCNRKDLSYTVPIDTDLVTQEDLIDDVCRGLAALVGADSAVAEFAEVSASYHYRDPDAAELKADYLILTGPADGAPVTITTDTTQAPFSISVAVQREAVAGQNEVQRVVLAGPPTGGTFTMTFDGQTTGSLDYNASAATITTALEGLSNIASGDVTVTGDAPDFTVEFKQAYAGANVPLMTGNGGSLTGGAAVSVVTITQGSSGTNQTYTLEDTTEAGVYAFGFVSKFQSQAEAYGAAFTASSVKALLEAWEYAGEPIIGVGNVNVTKSGRIITIELVGSLAGQDYDVLDLYPTLHTSAGVTVTNDDHLILTETASGNPTDVNEVQRITLANSPAGGTFTLTYSGQTTGNIAYNAAAADVATALKALSNIGDSDVSVAGNAGGPYTVTFVGALAGTDVSQITASGSSLTGSAVNISVTQNAVADVDEQQVVSVVGNPSGGTFTLTYDGQETGNIDWDATAAEVDTALEALSNIDASDLTVSGDDGGPYTITFSGSLAGTDAALLTGDPANLTGSGTQTLGIANSIEPTGPNHADDPENWSTGSLPATGDTVILENCATDILYGLETITDTVAKLHIKQSFTGQIGLPDVNEDGQYFEYRPKYWKIEATEVFIGEGVGDGSRLIRLDTSTIQTAINVLDSGRPIDASLPAVVHVGSNASNVLRVFKGSFGSALGAGETSQFASIQVGYKTDVDGDSEVLLGPGATLGTLDQSGGDVTVEAALGATVATGGTLTINGTGNVASLALSGEAYCHYNTTGTLGGNPKISDEAVLDFSQDMRAKTVTNPVEVASKDATVIDPFKAVAGLVMDLNFVAADLNGSQLGTNVRITRGTPA